MARSSNAAAVRAMWDALTRDGIDAFLELAPEDVEWRPASGDERPLWGARDLREMFKSLDSRGERLEAEIDQIEEIGDDAVLVVGTLRRTGANGTAEDQLAWLYSFRDGRLWRATAHHSAAEAREAARFSGGQLAQQVQRGPVLSIEEQARGDDVELRLGGELDLGSAPLLAQAIERVAAPGRTIRIELAGIEFMDSTGMRAILLAQRNATQQGWTLRLGRAREHVQRVFALTGMERLLPFDPPEPG